MRRNRERRIVWHKLGRIFGGAVIALSSSGCGGRSEDLGGPLGNSGNGGENRGGSSSGGQPHGGRTYGGSSQGGQSSGGAHYGGQTSGGGFGARTSGGYGGQVWGGAGYGGVASGGVSHGGAATQGGQSTGGFATGGYLSGGATTGGSSNACAPIEDKFQVILQSAKRCDPASNVQQCTLSVPSGLQCGCPTFVNQSNAMSLDLLKQLQAEYSMANCGALGVTCGACYDTPTAYCSPAGLCEDVHNNGPRSCLVNGKLYPHGATGIPDPGSCNTCSCDDGSLSCSQIFCASLCAVGTAVGMQCAACGPTDACLLPDYECLPTCTDQCPNPNQICLSGLCRTGVCG